MRIRDFAGKFCLYSSLVPWTNQVKADAISGRIKRITDKIQFSGLEKKGGYIIKTR